MMERMNELAWCTSRDWLNPVLSLLLSLSLSWLLWLLLNCFDGNKLLDCAERLYCFDDDDDDYVMFGWMATFYQ